MSESQLSSPAPDSEEEGPDYKSIVISAGFLVGLGVAWLMHHDAPGTGWTLAWLLMQVCVISIVIWQACDPFADAAQWIGKAFHLPGSVRGATLDAVASSMPELFSGIFFVILAVNRTSGGTELELVAAGAEGYGSTIATCAGSAVYNMILIPAFCALTISFARRERPTIDIEDEVISRDGMWFVGCELLLVLFLFQPAMHWWMGAVFLGLYVIYIVHLSRSAKSYRRNMKHLHRHFETHGIEVDAQEVVETLRDDGVRISRAVVIKTQLELSEASEDDDDDDTPETAGVLFGLFEVPLSHSTVWLVIAVSTLIAALACYFLVQATLDTAEQLNVPAFFVAVILAAAASSVPDTFLAIGAARRGDDSGAVSNAFGSNIFDICICLSIPLFVNAYLTGWEPVSLTQDGKPIAGLAGLQLLLVTLTAATLAIMWHKRQLTRLKALVLCGLYGVFIGYAVLGSLNLLPF
jgi:Ca2+/Na+ antiporter